MLTDDLKRLLEETAKVGCVVNNWILKQDKDIQDLMGQLVGTQALNLSQLFNALLQHDPALPFKRTSLNSHMRGICSCPKA